MSPANAQAKAWTCDRCAVSAGRIDGEATPLPASWERSEQGSFCLTCRRERAGEAALEAAPSNSPVEARAKLRRAALIEFEVARTPDHPDGVIARACRTSVAAVTGARQRLCLPDPQLPKAGRAKRRQSTSH
jgi:hypothetical protein